MRLWLSLVFFLLSSTVILAQTTVTGRVTDTKTGSPVPGVSVKIKSSKKGTTTNSEGVFTIQAAPDDVLEISEVGYKTQSIKVGSQSSISVAFEQSAVDLSEVVVVGSRGAPRVKFESPVPVDIVKMNSIEETTARPDLESQLNMALTPLQV